jgi:hypothetical protein
MKMNPNAKGETCVLSPMHFASNVQNQPALYYLTLNGAHYNELNARGKDPIELLINQFNNQKFSHQAYMCLLAIQKGMHDRIALLQTDSENSKEVEALLLKSDLITRALANKSK